MFTLLSLVCITRGHCVIFYCKSIVNTIRKRHTDNLFCPLPALLCVLLFEWTLTCHVANFSSAMNIEYAVSLIQLAFSEALPHGKYCTSVI